MTCQSISGGCPDGPCGPPPPLPLREFRPTPASRQVDPSVRLPGIGVFGTGNVVEILVPLLRSRGFKVEAIWGQTPEAAEDLARRLAVPFYTDRMDEVLLRKDVDLIFIMCPPNLHSQIAVKALGIGKHVLCDRPAGLCQADVLKMVRAAQYYPSLISVVGHWLRFLPAFIRMRCSVQEGYVGEVTVCDVRMQCGRRSGGATGDERRYDWTCSDVMGGGVLATLGSHVIDIVSYVTGQRALRVHGMLRTFRRTTARIRGIRQISSDDFCTFQMEMSQGACATISLNDGLPGQFVQEVLVCGTEGHVMVRGGDLYGQRLDSTATREEVLYVDTEDSNGGLFGGRSNGVGPSMGDGPAGDMALPKPYLKGLVKTIGALKEAFAPLEDRRSWVKEPVEAAATFEDGQYIAAVIDAVRLASRNREWVKVKLQTEEADPNPFLSAAVRRSIISS